MDLSMSFMTSSALPEGRVTSHANGMDPPATARQVLRPLRIGNMTIAIDGLAYRWEHQNVEDLALLPTLGRRPSGPHILGDPRPPIGRKPRQYGRSGRLLH